MMRNDRLLLIWATVVGLVVVLAHPAFCEQRKYVIGFSQATTTEPWRLLFNQELLKEAKLHPEVELLVRDGMDDVGKQSADVEEFLLRKVDAILISPKVSEPLTPVVNKAFTAGIPIFVLDRDIANDQCTQFIGSDNLVIGRAAGEYAVKLLGGKGRASGNVVEIWGGMGSTPAKQRHQGFFEVISQEPGIKVVGEPADGDWKQHLAYDIMAKLLERHPKIDLVYGHNDPMAYGAFLAAKDVNRDKKMAFLGIDAIPGEGVKWVHEGALTATFLYMTPGAEGLRQALLLLEGQTISKRVTLPTQTVDHSNAMEVLKAHGMVE
ncbi:MAG: substrate-binding domain-containing protein [Syntrophobacteraceae bacterium]